MKNTKKRLEFILTCTLTKNATKSDRKMAMDKNGQMDLPMELPLSVQLFLPSAKRTRTAHLSAHLAVFPVLAYSTYTFASCKTELPSSSLDERKMKKQVMQVQPAKLPKLSFEKTSLFYLVQFLIKQIANKNVIAEQRNCFLNELKKQCEFAYLAKAIINI